MWILPRPLHTSGFVPDTEALNLDCTELSEICARSLFVRSKPSPARTWSLKWKRDSWTALLSGRILRPSHGPSFLAAWTSSLEVTHASPLAPPASGSEPTTLGTSGPSSQMEFGFCDPDSAISKMSKDTLASDSERSLESWNKLVTRRRGEYSRRAKSAHRISGSGSSSWPSVVASEVRQGFQDRSRGKKGSQESLTTAVVKETSNWPTPDASNHRDGETLRKDNNLEQGGFHGVSLHHAMTKYGQAAPASSSSGGSRQGLSEPSQQNWQTFAHGTHNRGETPHRQVVKALVNGEKVQTQMLTVDQVFAEEIKGTNKQLWPTITAHTPDMESNGPNGHSGTYLAGAVKQWMTPRACEAENPPMGVDKRHQGLTHQVKHSDQWATPTNCDHKGATTPEACKQWESRGQNLPEQTASITAGKLNPRWVETLMGLPVGWVMPSCACPVTIAPTNCDCSATASSLPQQNERL